MDNVTTALTRQAPALSMEMIKQYICPKATDQEAFTFLQLCKAQGLNPFLKEAYLIKYGNENATIITGKDTFTKRADRLPQYDGFKAGIIVLVQGAATYREGSFILEDETLLGGWAEVYRKDRSQSFRNEVSLNEYARKKSDGSLMSNWRTMPATMIRKVALVQSLREAFPDEFGGMYSPEEMPVDASALPVYDYQQPPKQPDSRPPIQTPQTKTPPKQEPVGGDTGTITANQTKAIHALLTGLEITDDLQRHEVVTDALGLPDTLTSFGVLTKAQASEVIKKLGELADEKRASGK